MFHPQPLLRTTLVAVLLAGACSDPEPSTTIELGSPATSAQIQAARDAADGVPLDLAIQGAYVTYVREQTGLDGAGFFIQAQAAGPALFVAVDPASLAPPPLVGDQVNLAVTEMTTVDSRREATALSGWAVVAGGAPISALQQELSSVADLVTGLGGYESELARVAGTLRTDFSGTGAGSGFVTAALDTAALVDQAQLVFRLPTALRDDLGLAAGCSVTVALTPLWRSGTTAQVTAWTAADLAATSCPAPRVLSAAAASSTELLVTFDRILDPASVLADGSQFTFDGGLVATAASVAGRDVTVTTTAQVAGTVYTISVASSLRDEYGAGVDPANAQATFAGFTAPPPAAGLVINEVNANLLDGADLVELRAVTAGTTGGAVLQVGVGAATPLLATLPEVTVSIGDLIVVHVSPTGLVTETSSVGECADAACYAGAWDVAGETAGAQGIAYTTRILALYDAAGVLMDAVPFTDLASGGIGATFLEELQTLQTGGDWLPSDCGGSACDLAGAQAISVDWSGLGDSAAGFSVARTADADSNTSADWGAAAASSFGAPN